MEENTLTINSMRRRRSRSAEAAFGAELERVRAMTLEQRVFAALEMKENLAWLREIAPAEKSDE